MTLDNFAEIWPVVDATRRKAKKKRAAGKFAFFFADGVFAVLLMLVVCGLLGDQPGSGFYRFLKQVPYVLPIWEKTGAQILPERNFAVRAVFLFLAVSVICILVFCVFCLFLLLVYHPFKKK